MTTKLGLGVPLPLLAPVTASWAAPFTVVYLALQSRIVYYRLSTKTLMGDTTDSSRGTSDPLYVANRSQVNFIENVPLALIVALLAELNGADRKYINYGLGAVFVLRLSHVWGMSTNNSLGAGRPVGYYGTQAVMAAFAGYLGYLVKGYWQL